MRERKKRYGERVGMKGGRGERSGAIERRDGERRKRWREVGGKSDRERGGRGSESKEREEGQREREQGWREKKRIERRDGGE